MRSFCTGDSTGSRGFCGDASGKLLRCGNGMGIEGAEGAGAEGESDGALCMLCATLDPEAPPSRVDLQIILAQGG